MPHSQSIKSPIGKRLMIYIILFSSLITLVITAVQLYRDYNIDIEHIHSELEQIENVHLDSLTAALWASNKKLLQTSIEGILKIKDMQYIEIRDEKKVWAKAGEEKGKNIIQRKYPMQYHHRNKDINIGTLIVDVNLDGVYQRLLDKAWIILISNGIKTAFVALFIYFLFYRMVARHLSSISAFSERHDPLAENTPLKLDRKDKKYDEFDVVVKSINDMHTRLHEQLLEINQQKQYLAQTLNSIGDAVVTTDEKGNVTRLNPVAEQLTGWTNDEACKQSLKTIFPIIDASTRAAIANPVDKVLVTGETVYLSNHTTLIAKDGTEYQIADSAAPILNEDNKILGMVLVFNDVTEQYHIREALKRSEKKYNTLTTVSPVGVFYTDPNGNCLYVNEKWCEIAGMSPEEAQGQGWIKGLHPDDREHIFAEWHRATKNKIPFKLEYRFQQDNEVRKVLGQTVAEKDDAGKIIGYVGTITDITEREKAEDALLESEKKLQLIHSQVPGVVYQFRIDSDGKKSLPYASKAVETYIGLTAETVMDDVDKWFALLHPDDAISMEQSTIESQKNLSKWQWEGRFIRDDGEVIWMRGTSIPERLEDGSTLWSGLFIDVTERVQTAEIIRRSQKMDALGKLTGGVAHDYNNMLGVVLGYSELLKAQLADQPKLQSYVDKISHAGERGAKLTKKLLAFSKNKSSDVKKFDINTLINDEQHMLEKTLTARIKLVLELEDNLWPVCLDESELEDAILNLSINAMHAIENNGQLTIATSNVQISTADGEILGLNPGDYARLSISDTGCGIDEASKERIFDPFYSTKGEDGTGLGLSQVYGFISRCGGTITVKSKLAQGTTFTLYFPQYLGQGGTVSQLEAKNNASLQGQESILVVDDEPALLDLTCEILSQQNYQVFSAERAKQALKILQREHIDLLLSDIIMPDMNGYALAAIVQEKYPAVKIQLASGYSGENHAGQVDTSLSQNILQKPYTSETLLRKIRALLR